MNTEGVTSVEDVTKVKEYQNLDVDFLVTMGNSRKIMVEVKTDYLSWKTGNITWETKTSKNIGCCAKSPCDRFFWCLTNESGKICRVLSIDARAIKSKIAKNERYLRLVRMGDNAEGYLLSIELIRNWNVIRSEWTV